MMNHENKRPVTLEDLLQLKRAERPSAEFWTRFDRELRAKQLAAIVEKRPWWSAVPRAFAGLSRFHLPLGATAVLALTIVSVREFRPDSPAPARPVDAKPEAAAVLVAVPVGESGSTLSEAASPAEATAAFANGGGTESGPAVLAFDADADAATPSGATEISQARGAALDRDAVVSEAMPPGRHLTAGNLASFEQATAAFGRDALGAPHGFEARNTTLRTRKADPLAQMTLHTAARRPLQLSASFTAATLPTVRSGERIASRITDDRLYDNVSRLSASGNSLGLRF